MKKWELIKNTREVESKGFEYYATITLDATYSEPEVIKTFKDKEEALKELEKYNCSYCYMNRYYLVEEFYIEEVELDEDGEETERDFVEVADLK